MPDLFYDTEELPDAPPDIFEDAQESVAVDKGAAPASIRLLGLHAIQAKLLTQINENRLPHAFIFHGPKGVGKCTVAMALARTLLAHTPPPVEKPVDMFFPQVDPQADTPKIRNFDVSSTHPALQLMAAGAHPDFLMIGADDETQSKSGNILIDQARKVPGFLRLKPSVESGWRIVIIDNADRLNRNAQNALLKILEEPPTRALLILVTHQIGRLLPTIRSRTQDVRFSPLSDDDFLSWLKEAGHAPDARTKSWIQALANNCPGQAQELLDLEASELIREFLNLWDRFPALDERSWIDYVETLTAADPDAYTFILRFWGWWLSAMIRAKIDPGCAKELEKLMNHPGTVNMIRTRTLPDLLRAHDQIVPLFERTLAVSLEKRQAIFSARMCMMASE